MIEVEMNVDTYSEIDSLIIKLEKALSLAKEIKKEVGMGDISPDAVKLRVTATMQDIGITANLKGYNYLRMAIISVINEPDTVNHVIKELYPSIAKKYKSTPAKVERAIRYALNVSRQKKKVGKCKNSEFIAAIADKIRLEMG